MTDTNNVTPFAVELEQLIRKHLGTPQWNEDYDEVFNGLSDAVDWIADEADAFPIREEVEHGASDDEGQAH